MEASLTIAPDGAAPVFHMVRLPDSVVFVQVMKHASFYPRLLRVVGDWRLNQRELVIASVLRGPVMTQDRGKFSLQRAATMVKQSVKQSC